MRTQNDFLFWVRSFFSWNTMSSHLAKTYAQGHFYQDAEDNNELVFILVPVKIYNEFQVYGECPNIISTDPYVFLREHIRTGFVDKKGRYSFTEKTWGYKQTTELTRKHTNRFFEEGVRDIENYLEGDKELYDNNLSGHFHYQRCYLRFHL